MPTIEITTDPARIDRDALHRFLCDDAYWSKGIPRETMERSLENSLCFTVLDAGAMVGFARVVTDKAVFAYLADVYVAPARRGEGLSRRLMEAIVAHPDLQGLRRFMLATRDAHGLYAQFGFVPADGSPTLMQRLDPDVYARS